VAAGFAATDGLGVTDGLGEGAALWEKAGKRKKEMAVARAIRLIGQVYHGAGLYAPA
jgi:hypothetical protein